MKGIVAIVGRPNVGKSTLFNRLTESRSAIVDEVSGVTRDRHYGTVEWNGQTFTLIDTGGYVQGSDDVFEDAIRSQVEIAIGEADLLIFVVDVVTGITDLDERVVDILRKSGKEVILAVNKVDNNQRRTEASVFYGFGLGEIYPISSINGSGTGDLLDKVVEGLEDVQPVEESDLPKFAVVGKPNVGKSSLINTMLGEDRNIVTPIAGTTRDAISTRFNAFGFDFEIVDTAGLRKKSKVHEDLEFYSVMRTIRSLEKADVCILLIDAEEGITAQDLSIIGLAEKNKKGLVLCVNKWDLIEKDHMTVEQFKQDILKKTAPFTDYPIIFTSVLKKQRVLKAFEEAMKVYENRNRRIPTRALNDYLLEVIKATPPPAVKGKYIKIKYITQIPSPTPSFAFFCNHPQYVKDPYKRFLENKIRERFEFTGVPIQIYMRKK